MDRNRVRYLYTVVFITGMTSLAIELSASRLLGNVFGTSNLVWASIIGLILIYLTAGYYIGGNIADKYPDAKLLYIIITWSALFTAVVPVISSPILRIAADAFDQLSLGVLFGSFVAVLILLIIPVTLIGTVSPFAIRLLADETSLTGRLAGRVYAISTLGSFIGTFLPVLILIPTFGTARTFFTLASVLMVAGLIGIFQMGGWRELLKWGWMAILLVVMYLIGSRGPIKNSTGQIYETESAYNYIQVLEIDGYRYLRLNEGQGVHSVWHPQELFYQGPWEQFLVAPFFNQPDESGIYTLEKVNSMAIVGLAAGTLARQATEVFGPILIDGFEIDPEIIRIGKEYFGMNQPNLKAIAQDGRLGLERSDKRYSIIAIDAYRPPYIPWHMTTLEFFQVVEDHLKEDGVLVINVGRAPNDRRLVNDLTTTIRSIFPSVYIMDIPDTFNSIVYATLLPTDITNLYQNLVSMLGRDDIHPLLLEAIKRTIVFQQEIPEHTTVYTDDRAPVEWVTNSLVINFLFSENMEMIK